MGASVGCQSSWDASDSPRCLTFLLALSNKKNDLNLTIFIKKYLGNLEFDLKVIWNRVITFLKSL